MIHPNLTLHHSLIPAALATAVSGRSGAGDTFHMTCRLIMSKQALKTQNTNGNETWLFSAAVSCQTLARTRVTWSARPHWHLQTQIFASETFNMLICLLHYRIQSRACFRDRARNRQHNKKQCGSHRKTAQAASNYQTHFEKKVSVCTAWKGCLFCCITLYTMQSLFDIALD